MPENPALIKGKTMLPTLNYVIRTVCLAVWALFCLHVILSVTQKMPTLSKHTPQSRGHSQCKSISQWQEPVQSTIAKCWNAQSKNNKLPVTLPEKGLGLFPVSWGRSLLTREDTQQALNKWQTFYTQISFSCNFLLPNPWNRMILTRIIMCQMPS